MTKAWITIVAADVQEHVMYGLLSAYQTKSLAPGQSDPLPGIINERSDYVRNRITFRVQLSSTNYAVPPELKDQTVTLIIQSLAGRIPVLADKLGMDQTWRDRIRRAEKDLDIAGTEEFAISTPLDPVARGGQIQAAPATIVTSQTRQYTFSQMNGF